MTSFAALAEIRGKKSTAMIATRSERKEIQSFISKISYMHNAAFCGDLERKRANFL
ncbi:hypothetical protein [Rheinheimera soli]|uniref:hypothetical protein n=1 Tax=Rheinheimera soli TaxID=443616 RepID=UPI001E46C94F|nr:hypothetical protein [Rheinheimera soli]